MRYDEYRFTPADIIKYGLIYGLLAAAAAYVFYDSAWALLGLTPAAFFFFKYVKRDLTLKRKDMLKLQFKDMIDSVSSALKAGYSIENSFYESRKDMVRLYGRDSLIVNELDGFFLKLDNGVPMG